MNRFISRPASLVLAALAAAAFGFRLASAGANPFVCAALPVALWALLVSLCAPPSASAGMFCISYPIATAKTKASALVDTPLSEEQLWAKTLFLNEDMQYEDVPLPLRITFNCQSTAKT